MEYYGELQPPKKKAQSPPPHHHRHRFPKMHVLAILAAGFFMLYSPLFYLQLKLCFAAISVHSLGYSSNKNCMFLICNSILVILVKSSGLIENSSSSSSPLPQSPPQKPAVEESSAGSSPEMETENAEAEFGAPEQENAGAPLVEVVPEPKIQSNSDEMEGAGSAGEMEAETCVSVSDDDEEDIEEEEEEEEEGIGEEEDGEMSSEELYRKCEDFIKKMRGEINFEFS